MTDHQPRASTPPSSRVGRGRHDGGRRGTGHLRRGGHAAQPRNPAQRGPPGAVPPTSGSSHPHKPRPASQDASCPDVLLVDVPGTWESSLQDSPLNPMQFPNALLHNVTATLGQQFPSVSHADVSPPPTRRSSTIR